MNPCPPPTWETRSTDPRIKEAKKQLCLLETVIPVASTIHPMNAEEAEERLWLFELSFRSLSFQVFLQVPTYCEYLASADMLPLYQDHRTALQLLQWNCPGDYWLLKTPYHLHYHSRGFCGVCRSAPGSRRRKQDRVCSARRDRGARTGPGEAGRDLGQLGL